MDATNHLEDTTMATGLNEAIEARSQLLKDMGVQYELVREIEDRLDLLTKRIKPVLLDLSGQTDSDEACAPVQVPLRSAFGQGVADQNDRLRAISQQLARLENEIDL